MSIIGSMFTASTALAAFGNSMQVVGHNIANLNTTGFKPSRVNFGDVLPTVYGEIEAGHGVYVVSAHRIFNQGAFESTSNVTDLAIGGRGFFILRDGAGGTYFTRAGQFHINEGYNLTNPEGYFLQGVNGNISIAGRQNQPAQATTMLGITLNLDAAATTPTASFPGTLDASQSAWVGASNFTTVVSVHDSQGSSHNLTFLFRKTASNTWDYRVAAPRNELDLTSPTSTDLRQLGAGGTLVFNSNGTLNPNLSNITDITGMTWVNGATSQTIAAGNLSFANSTQYARSSGIGGLVQNGRLSGVLQSLAIDGQGTVRGLYSNGNTQIIDTIQLAQFPNADDLDPFGDTLFLATEGSGAAQIGLAGSGGRGNIVSGTLELSTVDLASEFVNLIASQRAFQMNARVITTAEEMYNIAAELK